MPNAVNLRIPEVDIFSPKGGSSAKSKKTSSFTGEQEDVHFGVSKTTQRAHLFFLQSALMVSVILGLYTTLLVMSDCIFSISAEYPFENSDILNQMLYEVDDDQITFAESWDNTTYTTNTTSANATTMTLHECLTGRTNLTLFNNSIEIASKSCDNSTNSTNSTNSSSTLQDFRSLQFDVAALFSQVVLPLEKVNGSNVSEAFNQLVGFKNSEEESTLVANATAAKVGSGRRIPLTKLRMMLRDVSRKLVALFDSCRNGQKCSNGATDSAFALENVVFVEKTEQGLDYTLKLRTMEGKSGHKTPARTMSVKVLDNSSRKIELSTESGFDMVIERENPAVPVSTVKIGGVKVSEI